MEASALPFSQLRGHLSRLSGPSSPICAVDRGLEVEHPRDEVLAFDFRCLDSAERKIMSDLEWRVIDAHRSYMIWGSPLGWIFSMIVLVATRYGPESKLGKTQRTMPDVTRETMCADRGAYPETRRSRQSHAVQ
jgi:hypothetical protein